MRGTRRASRLTGHVLVAMGLACAAVNITVPATTSVAGASPGERSSRCSNTAAAAQHWGAPEHEDNFDTPAALSNWYLYNSVGHAGNGRRTPDAVTVNDGVLTITGDPAGNSGGMGWKSSGQFGRWEVCARSPQSAPGYHSVLLLWPDAEDWPLGGEIDFMEAVDPTRQTVQGWVHYAADDQHYGSTVTVDATAWHAWAVEWTPARIAMYVDGRLWWSSTNSATFPPRSLHLCMQVDDFGGDISAGGRQQVDWARQYPMT